MYDLSPFAVEHDVEQSKSVADAVEVPAGSADELFNLYDLIAALDWNLADRRWCGDEW